MGDLSNSDYNIFPTPDSMGFQIVYEAELPFVTLEPELTIQRKMKIVNSIKRITGNI